MLVPREAAHANLANHQFLPGTGYLDHGGPPELPAGANGDKNCSPPVIADHESAHILRPPGGHDDVVMLWHAEQGLWTHPVPGKGNRMGWSPEHLSKAGWEYIGVLVSTADERR